MLTLDENYCRTCSEPIGSHDRRITRCQRCKEGHARRGLSERERQLVMLLGEGHANKEIAARMGLQTGTVKVYCSRLFKRLGISNRVELAMMLLRQELERTKAELDRTRDELAYTRATLELLRPIAEQVTVTFASHD
jgi:DNA-binding CsgD family transcriptional regulator